MTPLVFFLAAQITYDYGVLGLLGYSLMWVLSFIIIYFSKHISVFLKEDFILKEIAKYIYIFETVVCIFLVIKIILTETYFEYLTLINIALMIVILISIISLNKLNEKFVSIGTILLGITLSFLLPTLVYLKVSIPTVYSGIHFLSTDLLKFDRSATWLLICCLGIIVVVHQHLYRLVDAQYTEKKRVSSFLIAGIIAGIVTISFGSISFLGRAQAVLPDLSDRVSIQVIYRFGGQFGQFLFISITVFISFFILTKIWKSVKGSNKKSAALFILKYLLGPGFIVAYLDFTLLDVVLLFGLVWGPFLGVILFPTSSVILPRLSVAVGIIVGIVLSLQFDIPKGIAVGTIITVLIMLSIRLVSIYKEKYSSA